MALHYENVFRAHVAPPVGPEWTCFVEASSREAAWQKIRSLTSDEHDVYNVHSALKLIAEGESEDPELRLFEVGWGGGLPPRFCEHPVFVVSNPGDWARKWAAAIERDDPARVDAERYRWLRDREIPEWLDLWHQNPDRIDAAIDAAMEGENERD